MMDVSQVRARWLLHLFQLLDFDSVYLRGDTVLDEKAKSPHDMLQAFLNASPADLWAVLTNGIQLVNFRPIWGHRLSAKMGHSQRWHTGNSC